MDEIERKAIQLIRDEFVIGESRLYQHSADTFRWLMATLFAANGGALVALLSKGLSPMCPLAFFALGLVFSLLMGASSTLASVLYSKRLTAARAKMDEALITDKDITEELMPLIQKLQPNWKTFIPSYVGVASLAFFVIGLGAIAFAHR